MFLFVNTPFEVLYGLEAKAENKSGVGNFSHEIGSHMMNGEGFFSFFSSPLSFFRDMYFFFFLFQKEMVYLIFKAPKLKTTSTLSKGKLQISIEGLLRF